MKATISIEIFDNTSAEECAAQGVSMDKLHDYFTKGFTEILRASAAPGTKWELLVHISDNTKQEAGACKN